jgi:hypothetical protein
MEKDKKKGKYTNMKWAVRKYWKKNKTKKLEWYKD